MNESEFLLMGFNVPMCEVDILIPTPTHVTFTYSIVKPLKMSKNCGAGNLRNECGNKMRENFEP